MKKPRKPTIEDQLSDYDALENEIIAQRRAILLRLAADFVSLKQAAFFLGGITHQAINDRIKRGTLRAVAFEGRRYINRAQLPLASERLLQGAHMA
jgi:hypothetical protein